MSGSAQVIANMWKWANERTAGLTGVGLNTGTNMQNYARKNKRWKDITGNARAGLNGGSFWQNPFEMLVFIAHSVEYGIPLELAHDRKYQILEEARDSQSKAFYEG